VTKATSGGHSWRVSGAWLAFVGIVFLAGCGGGASAPPEVAGGVDLAANQYRNSFFGLTLEIPEEWHVASDETKEALLDAGTAAISADDAVFRAQMEAAKAQTHQLVMISEHPVGAPVAFNPNLVLMAERIGHFPGIEDGADYLFQIEQTLAQSSLPYEKVGEGGTHTIAGDTWDAVNYRIAGPGGKLLQEYLALKRGEYVLVFVTTAIDADQQTSLRDIASTLDFDT